MPDDSPSRASGQHRSTTRDGTATAGPTPTSALDDAAMAQTVANMKAALRTNRSLADMAGGQPLVLERFRRRFTAVLANSLPASQRGATADICSQLFDAIATVPLDELASGLGPKGIDELDSVALSSSMREQLDLLTCAPLPD